ncbi:MAG: hypothetical protein V1759_04475 [bacterium]
MTKLIIKKTELLLRKARIRQMPAIDHFRNMLIAGVNALPCIGGMTAALMESYIPKEKEKRLLGFIDSLANAIEKVKDQINEDLVNKDEFAFMLEKIFKGVLDNYQEEKINRYKAVFINALINKDSLMAEQKEVFLNILNNLTVRHLRILAVLKTYNSGDFIGEVIKYNPEYIKEDIVYVMEELWNRGLVSPKSKTIISSRINPNFVQLTPTGVQFIKFITLE